MLWYKSITPTEFELICTRKLIEIAEIEHLPHFHISHNEIVRTHDGHYQIDIKATFTAFNVTFLILCECKCYKAKVKRDTVVLLDQKLKSCGANKGIIIAVNGYQTGAILYAKEHGIALLNIVPTPGGTPLSPQNIYYVRKQALVPDSDYRNIIDFLSSHVSINIITELFSECEKNKFCLGRLVERG